MSFLNANSFVIVLRFRLSGFHPFTCDETDTDEDIERATLNDKLDLDLIFINTSQEALRLVTWALKKEPRSVSIHTLRRDVARLLSATQWHILAQYPDIRALHTRA